MKKLRFLNTKGIKIDSPLKFKLIFKRLYLSNSIEYEFAKLYDFPSYYSFLKIKFHIWISYYLRLKNLLFQDWTDDKKIQNQ